MSSPLTALPAVSNIFSAKAECREDLYNVINKLDAAKAGLVRVKSEDLYFEPNDRSGEISVEFHFIQPYDYHELLKVIDSVEDAHVIHQTLLPIPMNQNDMKRDHNR
jgi:hypothetical protein